MSKCLKRPNRLLLFHILIFAAGSAVLIGGVFQNSLWFDESYTVGLMSQNFWNVIKLSIYDVHPPLYYILLKLFTLLFGSSLTVMRLFSVIGAVLFAALGFTHIRKSINKETGFWFSLVALTLAATLVYALQIRMYTWAMYFVALCGIYAYRRVCEEDNTKNRILFVLFSVMAAYTHYFALFTVAVINIVLLIWDKREKRKLQAWFVLGTVQIAAYLPGIAVFLLQISLGGANWIQIEWPDLIFDFVSYPFLGDVLKVFVDKGSVLYSILGGLFLIAYSLFVWALYRRTKETSQNHLALKGSGIVFASVIVFSLLVSLFREIYYIRYTMVLYFFIVFAIAVFIAGCRRTWQKTACVLLLVAVFAVQCVGVYSLVYDPTVDAVTEYLDSKVEKGDIFFFSNANAYCVSVNYTDNTVYFYNEGGWGCRIPTAPSHQNPM